MNDSSLAIPASSPWLVQLFLRTIIVVALCSSVGCVTNGDAGANVDPIKANIDHLRDAVAETPNDARAHYELGNALFDAQRYEEALVTYLRATRLDPEFADAYTNSGLTYRVLGNLELAYEQYRQALALNPDDVITLQNALVALAGLNRPGESIPLYERLLRLRPDDVALRRQYAMTLAQLRRYDAAADEYAKVVAVRPDDVEAHTRQGQALYDAGHWDPAIEAWTAALIHDPTYGAAHAGIAKAYWQKDDYENAWRSVREAQRLGAYLDPAFLLQLQEDSEQLGPE